jgi:hypothetical protein
MLKDEITFNVVEGVRNGGGGGGTIIIDERYIVPQ